MKERVSTLMDGELKGREREQALRALCDDAELRRRWADYHRIAASLRGDPQLGFDFVERVMTAVDAEPSRAVSDAHAIPNRFATWARRWLDFGRAPAWTLAASLTGIAVVAAWPMLSAQAPGELPGALQARVETSPASASSSASSARLQEYLLAHQAYAPGGALTGGARTIRSVYRVSDTGGGR